MAKQRYTPQQVIAALKKTKGLQFLAAKALGCSHETIARYIQRYPSVREVAYAQRGAMVDLAEQKLLASILKGEAWGISLCLRTLGKDRGYVERQEQAGPNGQPLQQEIVLRIEYVDRPAYGATALAARPASPLLDQPGEAEGHSGGTPGGQNNGYGHLGG